MNDVMSDKKYLVYAIVFVLLLIVLAIGGTYAYFEMKIISEYETNISASFECLDISYDEDDIIDLEYQFPISDEYAIETLTPLTLTVTNNCTSNTEKIKYLVTLSSLSESTGYISDDKMRIMVLRTLPGGSEETLKYPTYLSYLYKLESGSAYAQMSESLTTRLDTKDYTTKNIYRVDYNELDNGETATYKILLWIDFYEGDTSHTGLYDNSTENKNFDAVPSVIANAYLIEPQYNVVINDVGFSADKNTAKEGEKVTISRTTSASNYDVISFKVNGALVEGDSFLMPNSNATVRDIVAEQVVFNITNSDSNVTTPATGRYGNTITLTSSNYIINSFEVNGILVNGDSFTMPKEDVTITNINKTYFVIVETAHYPIASSTGNHASYSNTFSGATSITVELTYQTYSSTSQCQWYDYLYIYGGYSSYYKCNSTLTNETLTISSNYIQIYFRNYNIGLNYRNIYGYRARIIPNYN